MAGLSHMVEADAARLPINGCIEYGNVGRQTLAQFVGTQAEKEKITHEQALNCQGFVRAQIGPAPSKPAGNLDIRLPRKIFFPSDASRPKETMLTLVGVAGIISKSDGLYVSFFDYQVQQYPGRADGKPEQVRTRPSFTGTSSSTLLAEFDRQSKNRTPVLSVKGGFSFSTRVTRDAVLTNAAFELVDANDNVVGSISVPVVVSVDSK